MLEQYKPKLNSPNELQCCPFVILSPDKCRVGE